jgi:hypothetical protein
MNHEMNDSSNAANIAGSERPRYEAPVLIDCGTVAAVTLGSGTTMGSDAWGSGGAGGGS